MEILFEFMETLMMSDENAFTLHPSPLLKKTERSKEPSTQRPILNRFKQARGVGPNAANLTKKAVLSLPYVFRVEAVGMPPGTYVCYFYEASPSHDFSFDIPGDPW